MRKLLGVIGAMALLVVAATAVQAKPDDKVTICHAAGQEGTTQYVTLTIAPSAVYGPAGHFYENGTPRAGHEQDYFGACVEPSVTPEPSGSLEPSVTPEPSETPESSESSSTGTPEASIPDTAMSAISGGPAGDLLIAMIGALGCAGLIYLATRNAKRA